MGLLSQGSPLSWEETKRHADHVRRHGILQFLHIYNAVKDRHKDVLKWGDEVSAGVPPPLWTPLPGHPAPPLFREALPATCPPGPLGGLRAAPRPVGPRASPCPGALSVPLAGGRPGLPGAWSPALSLLARSLSHSFIWVSPFIQSMWIGHWEGASMKKCDIWCFGEFTVFYTYLPATFRDPPSHLKMRFCDYCESCPRNAPCYWESGPQDVCFRPIQLSFNLQFILITSRPHPTPTLN